MSQSYESLKKHILKYQECDKYKAYKRKYDTTYRDENKYYARFRSTKSRLYSKYGEEIGQIKLANYVLRQKLKGIDLSLLLSPSQR